MKTTLLLSVLCAAFAVTASLTCGSDTCGSDEQCPSGGTACQCNTTQYTNTGKPPAPTYTCDGGKFNVQVSKCWLEKNGYNPSNITLNSTNTNCLATRNITNGTAQMTLHRPLTTTDCNTTAITNATHVTYSNQLYIYAKRGQILTRNDAVMNLSCTYPLNINVTLNVTLHPIIGVTEINVPGSNASFTALMVAYKDDQFSIPLTASDTLYVEDFVYISVNIPDLDVNSLNLKVTKISASPANKSSISYDILVDGCINPLLSADQITVVKNGNGSEARFIMKAFQISGFDTVSLTADLYICTSACTTTCNAKAGTSENSVGSVSILLEASERSYDTSSASGFSMAWTFSALIFSWILVKLM